MKNLPYFPLSSDNQKKTQTTIDLCNKNKEGNELARTVAHLVALGYSYKQVCHQIFGSISVTVYWSIFKFSLISSLISLLRTES